MTQQAKNLIAQARTEGWKRLELGNCGLTDLQTQVPELFELEQLEELVLSNRRWDADKQTWIYSANKGQANKLSHLPQAMAQLKRLKVLVCEGGLIINWEISDLFFLQNLPQLTHLNLSNNKITKLENLDNLPNLQYLTIAGNQITKLENLDKLPNLQQLDISRNKITKLENLDKLPKLEVLDISNNKITKLENLDKLPNFQQLDISRNQITKLENLDNLPDLKELYISNNKITKLENLDNLPKLQQLDITDNQITQLENLDKLPNLQHLSINQNRITKLENLDKLPKLQHLSINQNQITKLENLDNLPKLQQLVISYNQITKLENLDNLPNLQQLDITDNQITKLENLDNLPKLQQLVISDNQITKLENLDKLPKLQQLDIKHNKITDLSPLLPFLQQKEKPLQLVLKNYASEGEINVEGNPITTPPIEIVARGNEAVLRYFEELEKYGKDYLYEAKLLVVGEPKAGKTTLRKKLIDPTYKSDVGQQNEREKETVGVKIKPWQFPYTKNNGATVKFTANIWDFGGQDEQYPLHQYFLTEKAVYLLLSDDRADNPALDKWFNMIRLLGGNTSKLLVILNQIDRAASHTSSFNAKKYKEQGFDFELFSLDILYEPKRLTDLIHAIQNTLRGLPQIGNVLPAYCIPVRNALNALKKDYLTYEDYEKLCNSIKITATEQQKNALRYLCDVGAVVHYENDTDLSTIIILNPHWVIDAIYAVLINKTIKDRNGRFDKTWLFEYWQNTVNTKTYRHGECMHLLKLMLKNNFDICYRLKNDEQEQYLVPLCMPENLPEHTFDETDSLQLLFRYEIMPPGLVARLIVRLNNDVKDELVCKNAVVLASHEHETLAKVEEYRLPDDANKYIRICVTGKKREQKSYLAILKKNLLDVQNDWFKKLAYEEIIPCPCADCIKKGIPQPILLSAIRKRIEKKKDDIGCLSGNDINVLQLLGDAYTLGIPNNIDTIDALIKAIQTQGISKDVVHNIIYVIGNNNVVAQASQDTDLSTNSPKYNKMKITNNIYGGQQNFADRIDKIEYHAGNGITQKDFDEFKESLKKLTDTQQQEVSEKLRIIEISPEENRSSLIDELKTFLLETGVAINQNLIASGIYEILKLLVGG